MGEPRLEPIEVGDEEGCGFSYDHTLKLIDERDGSATYECTECGAEVFSDDDSEADR